MIGCDDPYTDCVCTVDDLFYDIVPGKDFHVNEIDIPGLCRAQVQILVILRVDCFFTALFFCAEGQKKRDVAEHGAQFLKHILHFIKFKYMLKPVHTPLDDIDRNGIERFCLVQNIFFCNADDRHDDFWCSGTDFNISDFDGIHDDSPFLKCRLIEANIRNLLRYLPMNGIALQLFGSYYVISLIRLQAPPSFCNGDLQKDRARPRRL